MARNCYFSFSTFERYVYAWNRFVLFLIFFFLLKLLHRSHGYQKSNTHITQKGKEKNWKRTFENGENNKVFWCHETKTTSNILQTSVIYCNISRNWMVFSLFALTFMLSSINVALGVFEFAFDFFTFFSLNLK